MSTITLPNVRIQNDVKMNVSLKDNGVSVDWTSLSNISAALYSDTQRLMAGPCTVSIDATDHTNLIVNYSATQPQYLGIQRLVVRCTYQAKKKTYDIAAFNFVGSTDGLEGETITITDPEIDVELEVSEVSTSLLDEVLDACIAATVGASRVAQSSVLFDAPQSLTNAQKQQARQNIGAEGGAGDCYTKAETNALLAAKQNTINDLADIRSGAAKGETALQSVPNTYRKSADQDIIDATKQNASDNALQTTSKTIVGAINENKGAIDDMEAAIPTSQEKASWNGKYAKPVTGIPETDLAEAVQGKLNNLKVITYGVPTYAECLADIQAGKVLVFYYQNRCFCNSKVDNDVSIIRFSSALDASASYSVCGLNSSDEWSTPIAKTAEQTSNKKTAINPTSTTEYPCSKAVYDYHDASKQDAISDLATIRSGAALGATALQSVPNTYRTASEQNTIDAGKISNPTGGTAGQVLTKTAEGEAWQDAGGGMGTDQEMTIASALVKLDGLQEMVATALCDIVLQKFPSVNIAPTYDRNNAQGYAVGAYVTHNNRLYKCITAVTEAELFDATKWQLTSVMAELVSIANQ